MQSWKTTMKILLALVIVSSVMYHYLEGETPSTKYNSPGESSEKQIMIPRTKNGRSNECIISNTDDDSSRYNPCLRRLDMSEKMDCTTSCQEAIQRYRKANLRRACTDNTLQSLNSSIGLWDDKGNLQLQQLKRLDHLFSVENSQLIYCSIPKVATTSWRRLLLTVTGDISSPTFEDGRSIHSLFRRKVKRLASYNVTEAQRRLKTYKKFFFVRDPLERMLSLFLDKAVKENWLRFNESQYEKFMKFIITRPSELIYKKGAEHWALGSHLCFPCDVSYDFIGRLETSERDTQYILDNFIHENRDRLITDRVKGHPTNSSNPDTKERYYQQVSKDVMMNFTNKYHLDYVLFNYDKPTV